MILFSTRIMQNW